MIIRTSSKTGPVAYEIADAPPRRVDETGEMLIAFTLDNVRGGTQASLTLRPHEIDRLYAAKRKLSR